MSEQTDYKAPVGDVQQVSMTWRTVTSSNITEVGYNTTQEILGVRFHFGSVYYYYEVPQEVYTDMISAESVGKFLHRSIKGKYAYGKLGD